MGGGEYYKEGKRNRERSTEKPNGTGGIKGIYSCRQSLYHLSYLEA